MRRKGVIRANVCLDKDREFLCEERVDIYRLPPSLGRATTYHPCIFTELALLPFISLSLLHSIYLASQPLHYFFTTFNYLQSSPSLTTLSVATLLCFNPETNQLVSLETPNYQERRRGQERGPDRGSLNTGEYKIENLSMKKGEGQKKN